MKEFVSAFDLLGNYRIIRDNGKPMNERATLIKYFVDTFKLNPKRLAPKMAHIETRDLYPLQSQVRDRINRQNITTARKYFYWAISTHAVHDERTAQTTYETNR